MSYVRNNPSPCCVLEPDCVVRAVALATGKSWDRVYTELSVQGFEMCCPFVVNKVWSAYLEEQGYRSYNDDSYGDSYNDGRSYGDGRDMEAELEEMANNRALPSSKRDAAKKMLAEIRKGDL